MDVEYLGGLLHTEDSRWRLIRRTARVRLGNGRGEARWRDT
jgi:hypothetical protein